MTSAAQPVTPSTSPAPRPVALVTGGSSGIGAASALELAEGGFDLALVGRRADALDEVAGPCRAVGARVESITADLTDVTAVESVVAGALQTLGRLDTVVHSAGISLRSMLEDTTMADFDEVFDINVRSGFALTARVVPHLPAGGSIVFVGSNVVRFGMPLLSAYSASKAAVEDLTRSLAVELGPRGIRVNAVSPGMTRTPMTVAVTEADDAPAAIADVPLGRFAEAVDVAACIGFLCSAKARHVTGSVLVVDGGRHLI